MTVRGDDSNSAAEAVSALLDEQPGPAATAESLTAVFRRHVRRRRKLLGSVAVSALCIGVGAGVLIGEDAATPRTQYVTGGQHPGSPGGPTTSSITGGTLAQPSFVARSSAPSGLAAVKSAGTYAAASAPDFNGGNGLRGLLACEPVGCQLVFAATASAELQHLRPLFVRSANGVTVRAFLLAASLGKHGQGRLGPCASPDALVLELSDQRAVAALAVPDLRPSSNAVGVVEESVVGTYEGAPMAVLAIHAGSGVAAVKARFASGAADQGRLVEGWAVLVAVLPGHGEAGAGGHSAASEAIANVETLVGNGQVAESFTTKAPELALPAACALSR
jgi:hypothetical protein